MTSSQQNQDQPEPNHTSFDRLVIEHQNELYAFIRSMIFNPDDARETLQDVNIILIRKREKFEMGTNFRAWAFTIARFECLSYLSNYKKIQWRSLDTGLIDTLADIVEEQVSDMKPVMAAMRSCLSELNEDQRLLIHYRYKSKKTLEKVAQLQSTTVPALKQKLYRVRNGLKNCILKKFKKSP